MAIASRRRSSATVQVVPAAPVTDAPAQVAAAPAKRKKRNRKPVMSVDGKPVHGLTTTPEGFNPEKDRLVRQQFASVEAWFLHMVRVQEWWAEHYRTLAADAAAHPEKYKKASSGVVKKELMGHIAKLEAALKAKGFSDEEIAAMVAE